MGVHTGDSITVAPAQTLTDREYQQMRDAAKAIMREIGVDTGGSNVQFGVDPRTGRQVVIEMNPRVSRSSALASKATGYPIAKVAAKLAVGYTLDEIPNDITGTTPASFEPAIDYVVVKIPRFAFEKFPEADETLTTHMKSVGEAMAIGRTFKEAFQKCVRSMEIQRAGYGLDRNDRWLLDAQRRHAAGETGAFDFLAVAPRGPGDHGQPPGRGAARYGRKPRDPLAHRPVGARGEAAQAEPGPSLLHSLCLQARLDRCAGARAQPHRSVVPRPVEGTGRVRERTAHERQRPRRSRSRGAAPQPHARLQPPAVGTSAAPAGVRPRPDRRRQRPRRLVQAGRHLRRRVRGEDALLLLDPRGSGGARSRTGGSRSPRNRSSRSSRSRTWW